MVDAILGFGARYPAVRIVVATRTPSYEGFFPDFNHFELAPFNERQMAEWACHKLYHRDGRAREALFAWLHSDRDLYEIVRNPLMLALLVHRYDAQGLRLPGKAEIIAEFIDALVSVWDNVRGIVRSSDILATPFRRLSRLCRLAFRNWMGTSDPGHRWLIHKSIDESCLKMQLTIQAFSPNSKRREIGHFVTGHSRISLQLVTLSIKTTISRP